MHVRVEESMERMHPELVVHLSWPEYKKWRLSGMEWQAFYRTEIKPQGIRVGDELWARKSGVRM
jgi:hypothetical protein